MEFIPNNLHRVVAGRFPDLLPAQARDAAEAAIAVVDADPWATIVFALPGRAGGPQRPLIDRPGVARHFAELASWLRRLDPENRRRVAVRLLPAQRRFMAACCEQATAARAAEASFREFESRAGGRVS